MVKNSISGVTQAGVQNPTLLVSMGLGHVSYPFCVRKKNIIYCTVLLGELNDGV